jgi:hypothetical protein
VTDKPCNCSLVRFGFTLRLLDLLIHVLYSAAGLTVPLFRLKTFVFNVETGDANALLAIAVRDVRCMRGVCYVVYVTVDLCASLVGESSEH